MPMVARMLQGLSGIQPERSVNPDEAVARGAALYAGHLLGMGRGRAAAREVPVAQPPAAFEVTNVNSHSLGVEGIETDTLRKRNVVLIPRNTPLPARHTERFATKAEGQRSIVIKVLEGESQQPGDCIAIGRTVVRDLPAGLPKGWPVEVTFEYGANGRLAVEALVPGTQHRARLELVRDGGLSSEGLTRWKQPVSDAGGFTAFAVGGTGRAAERASADRAFAGRDRPGDRLDFPEDERRRRGAGGPAALAWGFARRTRRVPGRRARRPTSLGFKPAAAGPNLPSSSARGTGGESACRGPGNQRGSAPVAAGREDPAGYAAPHSQVVGADDRARDHLAALRHRRLLDDLPRPARHLPLDLRRRRSAERAETRRSRAMTETSVPAVGIDLGTTYSVIARLDERGQPVTLVNAEGDRLTPSVVLVDGNDVVVGKEAMKAMSTEAEHVAECAKRDMGSRAYHRAIGGKQYPPEVIQAWILNKLRSDAMQQMGPFEKAVITVPAYFDEVRRKATQDAGYMAGCEVLDIINEPTAAAVAFGFQQGFLKTSSGTDRPRRVLVYDLGGGTFDVTVMEIRGNEFLALATDGDVALGGYDWDQRLLTLAADAFHREHSIDLRESPAAVGKLWRECEDAKRTLSARPKAPIVAEHRGKVHRLEVTREQFEDVTQDLLDRTRFTCVQALRAAGLDWPDLDRVLLVGGSTRMPMVRAMLEKIAGKPPDASVAADEAVAHGAALQAGLVLTKREGRKERFSIRNVNSHSLGVVGVDPQTKRRRNGTVIPRNTPLPVSAHRQFKTARPDQRSILVQIVEGESPSADECMTIGRCTVADLPPGLPAKSPVEVTFHYRSNGRLKVRVKVPGPENTGGAGNTGGHKAGAPRSGKWRPRSSARTASARSTWTPGESTSREKRRRSTGSGLKPPPPTLRRWGATYAAVCRPSQLRTATTAAPCQWRKPR